jgi:phage-Barnase-EndoU-ColicinE5/D-RelE like nuclease3
MKTANTFVNLQTASALSAEKITQFAAEAMRIADRQTLLVIGPVVNVALIQAQTKFNLAGYTRVLDNYGVRHTMKQHSDPGRELKRGQLAVTLEDFALIPLITGEPDYAYADGKNRIGREVIVFVKLIDGIGYRHVEEIRGKHKLVATDSMRKKKGTWGAL